ncbi:MAG: hypothetical protein ACJAYF_002473 [Arenicella sp.]|jgi:hypothetical protein
MLKVHQKNRGKRVLNKQGRLTTFARILIYLVIGIAAGVLFSYLAELYVDLFGETFTPMSKLVASTVSLLVCLLIVFSANHFSLKLNIKRLGVTLGLVMFAWLYIIGPGLRAPITLYITSVSFPYNINMVATLLMPMMFARAFGNALSRRGGKTDGL